MNFLSKLLLGLLLSTAACANTFNTFTPANGIQKCTTTSSVCSSATAGDINSLTTPQTPAESSAGFTPTTSELSFEPYELRRYGAINDGVTDDTAAINTWINVCQQPTAPGSCFVYPGVYKTTGNHNITVAFNILGKGGGEWNTTKPAFLLSANATNLFHWNGLNNAGPTIRGAIISGIVFNGGSFTVSDALVSCEGMSLTTFRDSGIHNVTGVGLRLRQFWDSQFDNVMIRSVDAHSTTSGIIDIDSRYNSDNNQNVNNLAFRHVHLENNQGTYLFVASDSNLFNFRLDDSKIEIGSGALTGGPFPLFNVKQADSFSIYDNQFDGFTAATGYDRYFKLGDTTANSSVVNYNIHGNSLHNISSSTYYIDTEVGTSGEFWKNNQEGTNALGLVANSSSRAVRFQYPINTAVQSDVNQTISSSQNALSGFVGVDQLGNTGPTSFTQDPNSLSITQSVIVSPASASSILVSLPTAPFAGMSGALRVGVRCYSATGAGSIKLQYNTTTTSDVVCPASTFGTISFYIPQSELAVLSSAGSNRFRLSTGVANAEAVTLDGVYFQQTPTSIGDTVNNPTFSFLGTGAVSFGGGASFTGSITTTRISVTGSTVATNGIYLPATNSLGFSTSAVARGAFDSNGNLYTLYGLADQSGGIPIVPTSGNSLTIPNNRSVYLLNPAGTLATLTIIMPSSPIDGQEIKISSQQTVTTLTLSPNGGQTISGAPTTITASQPIEYIYNLTGTNWYRLR